MSKRKTLSDFIMPAGAIAAIIGAVAAVAVVPEVREFLGLRTTTKQSITQKIEKQPSITNFDVKHTNSSISQTSRKNDECSKNNPPISCLWKNDS